MSNCCANGDCPKCKEALKRFEGLSAILHKPIPLDKELAGIAYTHPHFSQTIRRAISRIAALEAAIKEREHEEGCPIRAYGKNVRDRIIFNDRECTCWKRTALNTEGK